MHYLARCSLSELNTLWEWGDLSISESNLRPPLIWYVESHESDQSTRKTEGSLTPKAHANSVVLNSSPRAPPLYIFFMSLLVNTPDSDNQLVRSALHEWTVFRLTCSLHSVHCSLLPEQGKSVEVYFTSEHSLMDLRCTNHHIRL